MIVATYFDGDNDKVLAALQHDVYGDALIIMVKACNRFALFAKVLLKDKEHDNWGQIQRFDHRTLQMAHDLLAAAWRFENNSLQLELPIPGMHDNCPYEERWLAWLRREMSDWIDCPRMVRSVQLILTNQNKPIGYAAETRLSIGIMNRFELVPWQGDLREALLKDLEQDRLATVETSQPLSPDQNKQKVAP